MSDRFSVSGEVGRGRAPSVVSPLTIHVPETPEIPASKAPTFKGHPASEDARRSMPQNRDLPLNARRMSHPVARNQSGVIFNNRDDFDHKLLEAYKTYRSEYTGMKYGEPAKDLALRFDANTQKFVKVQSGEQADITLKITNLRKPNADETMGEAQLAYTTEGEHFAPFNPDIQRSAYQQPQRAGRENRLDLGTGNGHEGEDKSNKDKGRGDESTAQPKDLGASADLGKGQQQQSPDSDDLSDQGRPETDIFARSPGPTRPRNRATFHGQNFSPDDQGNPALHKTNGAGNITQPLETEPKVTTKAEQTLSTTQQAADSTQDSTSTSTSPTPSRRPPPAPPVTEDTSTQATSPQSTPVVKVDLTGIKPPPPGRSTPPPEERAQVLAKKLQRHISDGTMNTLEGGNVHAEAVMLVETLGRKLDGVPLELARASNAAAEHRTPNHTHITPPPSPGTPPPAAEEDNKKVRTYPRNDEAAGLVQRLNNFSTLGGHRSQEAGDALKEAASLQNSGDISPIQKDALVQAKYALEQMRNPKNAAQAPASPKKPLRVHVPENKERPPLPSRPGVEGQSAAAPDASNPPSSLSHVDRGLPPPARYGQKGPPPAARFQGALTPVVSEDVPVRPDEESPVVNAVQDPRGAPPAPKGRLGLGLPPSREESPRNPAHVLQGRLAGMNGPEEEVVPPSPMSVPLRPDNSPPEPFDATRDYFASVPEPPKVKQKKVPPQPSPAVVSVPPSVQPEVEEISVGPVPLSALPREEQIEQLSDLNNPRAAFVARMMNPRPQPQPAAVPQQAPAPVDYEAIFTPPVPGEGINVSASGLLEANAAAGLLNPFTNAVTRENRDEAQRRYNLVKAANLGGIVDMMLADVDSNIKAFDALNPQRQASPQPVSVASVAEEVPPPPAEPPPPPPPEAGYNPGVPANAGDLMSGFPPEPSPNAQRLEAAISQANAAAARADASAQKATESRGYADNAIGRIEAQSTVVHKRDSQLSIKLPVSELRDDIGSPTPLISPSGADLIPDSSAFPQSPIGSQASSPVSQTPVSESTPEPALSPEVVEAWDKDLIKGAVGALESYLANWQADKDDTSKNALQSGYNLALKHREDLATRGRDVTRLDQEIDKIAGILGIEKSMGGEVLPVVQSSSPVLPGAGAFIAARKPRDIPAWQTRATADLEKISKDAAKNASTRVLQEAGDTNPFAHKVLRFKSVDEARAYFSTLSDDNLRLAGAYAVHAMNLYPDAFTPHQLSLKPQSFTDAIKELDADGVLAYLQQVPPEMMLFLGDDMPRQVEKFPGIFNALSKKWLENMSPAQVTNLSNIQLMSVISGELDHPDAGSERINALLSTKKRDKDMFGKPISKEEVAAWPIQVKLRFLDKTMKTAGKAEYGTKEYFQENLPEALARFDEQMRPAPSSPIVEKSSSSSIRSPFKKRAVPEPILPESTEDSFGKLMKADKQAGIAFDKLQQSKVQEDFRNNVQSIRVLPPGQMHFLPDDMPVILRQHNINIAGLDFDQIAGMSAAQTNKLTDEQLIAIAVRHGHRGIEALGRTNTEKGGGNVLVEASIWPIRLKIDLADNYFKSSSKGASASNQKAVQADLEILFQIYSDLEKETSKVEENVLMGQLSAEVNKLKPAPTTEEFLNVILLEGGLDQLELLANASIDNLTHVPGQQARANPTELAFQAIEKRFIPEKQLAIDLTNGSVGDRGGNNKRITIPEGLPSRDLIQKMALQAKNYIKAVPLYNEVYRTAPKVFGGVKALYPDMQHVPAKIRQNTEGMMKVNYYVSTYVPERQGTSNKPQALINYEDQVRTLDLARERQNKLSPLLTEWSNESGSEKKASLEADISRQISVTDKRLENAHRDLEQIKENQAKMPTMEQLTREIDAKINLVDKSQAIVLTRLIALASGNVSNLSKEQEAAVKQISEAHPELWEQLKAKALDGKVHIENKLLEDFLVSQSASLNNVLLEGDDWEAFFNYNSNKRALEQLYIQQRSHGEQKKSIESKIDRLESEIKGLLKSGIMEKIERDIKQAQESLEKLEKQDDVGAGGGKLYAAWKADIEKIEMTKEAYLNRARGGDESVYVELPSERVGRAASPGPRNRQPSAASPVHTPPPLSRDHRSQTTMTPPRQSPKERVTSAAGAAAGFFGRLVSPSRRRREGGNGA